MGLRAFTLQTQAACRLVLHDQMRQAPSAHPAARTDDLSLEALAQRMGALPDRYLHVLLLRFGCEIPYEEIDALLDMEQAAGTAGFALQLLAYGLHLSTPPSERLLQAAARQILSDCAVETGEGAAQPSRGFTKRMRAILSGKSPQPLRVKRLPLRTLIVAAIIAALLLALTIATIAAIVRNSFSWSVTQDAEGIEIAAADILREPTAEDYEEMRLYQPVLPDGFVYAYTDDREARYLIDYYHNKDGRRIILWKTLAGPSVVFRVNNDALDSYEEIEMDGTTYLYHEHSTHGRGVINWEIDGFAFMLVTPMEKEQALQIACSVSR